MIYQIRTYNSLCLSKKYFENKDDVRAYLKNIIALTEKFRANLTDAQLFTQGWNKKVSPKEIELGVEVLKINPEILEIWESIFGKEKDVCNPELSKFAHA